MTIHVEPKPGKIWFSKKSGIALFVTWELEGNLHNRPHGAFRVKLLAGDTCQTTHVVSLFDTEEECVRWAWLMVLDEEEVIGD